ncbi:NAD(P)-dependent oxidoreductase [Rhodophyticola sp. CCM32]|uniref:NAD-dependent epimerase/dehydratase family protein n=1 Tax=Rhodophyticola sp. CCM32 TaxID=2916397 RepID=UPI00107F7A14|nr:NAD(P)-dependent oxidoreductase [Rhodophyticola sp. CCM32]QBX99959.1 NAD(P)-dependent oxidoreductase [Rhodophyticola sp. CCM32]
MMRDKPVLVTGAGGFVCSEIALALHHAGRNVLAVDQWFDAPTRARLGPLRRIEAPLPEVLAGLKGAAFSAVIHGAAITAPPARLLISRAAHIRQNVELLTGALDFARGAGATDFLFLSSMGVFGPGDRPVPDGRFTEVTCPSASCAYATAKRAGEDLTAAAAETGFATLSLRLGNIFGPHEVVRETRQTLCLVARMLAEARGSRVITTQTPEALREWSWLPDLAEAIAGLMGDFPKDGPPVLHAGTPPVQSDLETARAIAARVPGTLIRLAPPPHPALRQPMGSNHPTLFNRAHWTPMAAALDSLIPQVAMP